MHRYRLQRISVPNARNAKMMGTKNIRPFRRGTSAPPPPVAVGVFPDQFNFTMDVGQDGAELGFSRGDFGSVTPDGQNGIQIESMIVFTTGQVRIELSGVAPTETRDILVIFDGGNSEVNAFQGGGLWGGFNSDLKDYLLANVGNTVPLTWEAIT